ncbi:malate synthase 1, glyoxysomal-like [Trichogramma pretiosum]|uniref:malate synthase 1, glyoxysomal-like n=1 Tax=Trichogramma pretiosum TaxID=7493 RepID=UPI0006C9E170|nr:malate synthase 1, glyoxysomal-like [Trichogramma pretiosum]
MNDKLADHYNVFLSPSPAGLEQEFHLLLTADAIKFLIELTIKFQDKVNDLYLTRLERKFIQKKVRKIPRFFESSNSTDDWKVAPVNHRLQNRTVDLGDVSPSDYIHFTSALKAKVEGIQVDFDDGHCPTWKNQIFGLYNIYRVVHDQIPNVPKIADAPVLIFRPRAWNMIEHNMSINGKEIPGPLFDFGLLIYHTGNILAQCDSGPFFYLPKLEGASEAKLWNEIFTWSQSRLRIPYGTIKACVLIENILSSFELDQILYELKDHSLGLNCGVWDYTASIISKFGDDASFIIPDRNMYVDMTKPFLKKYMDLVVRTCHKRNAHATGGMVAKLLPPKESTDFDDIVQNITEKKLFEMSAGVDGFIIYDLKLVDIVNNLWMKFGVYSNQLHYFGSSEKITESDLLTLPHGKITEAGLKDNITIAILFIFNWLCGKGIFEFKGAIEDSATAEISRAQIWQWIRHSVVIENTEKIITRKLVFKEATNVYESLSNQYGVDEFTKIKLAIAFDIFLEIVNHREFPEYFTTYLNDTYIFRKLQASL